MLRTVDLLTRTRQLCLMANSPAAAKERPVSDIADDVAALRAAVLVPVLLGVQRQLPQERARLPDPVQARGVANARSADHARRRGVHRAVLLPLRPRRRRWPTASTRRSSRERLKLAEIARRGARRRRLLAALDADPVRRAVPVRRASRRCSARSNTASCPTICRRDELPAGNALVEGATFMAILLGTIVGGLAAKDGGDPALVRRADRWCFALLCWGCEPAHPADRRRARPTSSSIPTSLRSTGALLKRPLGRHAALVGRPRRRAGSGSSARSCCRCCRRW